jgi:CubicO group peptidase (beta-lactamase class C family)
MSIPSFLRILLITHTLLITTSLAQITDDQKTQIHSLVENTFDNEFPGGVVLVAHKDQALYQSAIGISEPNGTPLSIDSIFRIASVTKQFTAVAILQLAEQGKLNLDDDITRFIPEFDTRGDYISVEMLLNHTSGIRGYTSMPAFNPELEATDVTPEQIMEFFNNQDLLFKPGTLHSYSNSGYALLGIIIERVSKQTYAEYMQTNIFAKTGMKRAFAGNDHKDTTGFAIGHRRTRSGYEPTDYISLTWPYAAGCIETTVDDLHKWMRALFSGKLITQESINRAHTITTLPNGREIKYGYGWDILEVQGHPSVEHGGGIAGFVSHLLYIPSKEIFVAILCNAQHRGIEDLSAQLAAIALGNPFNDTKTAGLEVPNLKEYIGTYADHNGNERHIRINDGRLYSQRVGGMRLSLIPKAPDLFKMEGQLIEIEFERDESDEVIALMFKTRSRDVRWSRSTKPNTKAIP